jgi:hypothetical protein
LRSIGSIPTETRRESPAARRRKRLQLFRLPHRRAIGELIAHSAALNDLVDTFPALLFALATGYGTPDQRFEAARIVERGGTLKEAAGALGLPSWLRRVPSVALEHPLPAFPNDPEFAAVMTARLPTHERHCEAWLDRIATALQLIGRDCALWVAREPRLLPPLTGEDDFAWLMAWIWASKTPTAPGHRLLRNAWSPENGWKRARDEVAVWRKRIDLVGALADGIRDPWFENGVVQGLHFVHLDSVEAFLAESTAMDNCLDQYAAHLSYGRVRVFSVRRDGRSIADLELTPRTDEASIACISQIRGPRNRRASPHVWQAAHAWLGAQAFRPITVSPTPGAAVRRALRAFWTPYVAALERTGVIARVGLPTGVRPARYAHRLAPAGTRTAAGRSAPSPQRERHTTTRIRA